jgi:predicted peptidase
MRFAETHRLTGLILVSACHTDLGIASETISGYYSRPWLWEDMRKNVRWITQFHSTDDPFIPIAEARYVAEHIKSEVRSERQVRHRLRRCITPHTCNRALCVVVHVLCS